MEANELRIGNWVLIPTNEEIKIPAFPKKVKGITKFGELDFTEPQYPDAHLVPAIHCGGILLTEEWLLRFGFEKGTEMNGSQEYYIQEVDSKGFILFDFYLWKTEDGFIVEFEWQGYGTQIKIPIPYVHQLQNLYFALTGQELTERESK